MQALTLLNDPVYLMASRALATKMLAMKSKPEADRITVGFESIMARKPAPAELNRIAKLLDLEKAKYAADPGDAAKVLKTKTPPTDVANEAAYTIVAQVMFNLDEAITKE